MANVCVIQLTMCIHFEVEITYPLCRQLLINVASIISQAFFHLKCDWLGNWILASLMNSFAMSMDDTANEITGENCRTGNGCFKY